MNEGDRMCPECETESLVEEGLKHLRCLNPKCCYVIHEND